MTLELFPRHRVCEINTAYLCCLFVQSVLVTFVAFRLFVSRALYVVYIEQWDKTLNHGSYVMRTIQKRSI